MPFFIEDCQDVQHGPLWTGKERKKGFIVLVLESSWHTAQLKFSLVFTK